MTGTSNTAHALRWQASMILILACLCTACGAGTTSETETQSETPSPTPAPTPTPTPAPAAPLAFDFSSIERAADAFEVANMAVLIGDEAGVLYRYEKGTFTASQAINLASATKLVTGLTVWQLVEDGALSLDDKAGEAIAFWTENADDPRAQVTLEHTLAFTTGFNNRPAGFGCQGDPLYTLEECVRESYDGGLETQPGTAFSYGPEHTQIAALIVLEATGLELQSHMRTRLLDPLGVSEEMAFDPLRGDNPRYSGNLRATTDDYAVLLAALLGGQVVTDLGAYLTDRTASTTFAFRPDIGSDIASDWHYGLGFWKECDAPDYTPACDAENIISSPGAFGFTPWVDFGRGYWGIVAMEEALTLTVSPTQVSVAFEQDVQALVEAQLDAE